ncbi:ATP dependent DNA ligase domain-containing protein [Friedmanniella luteola]|uniref:ATP dependent DNA ligase domain-containing protein n=2 Tax=Friedmanniella luteola TaxID=546871 RepID=A0A1H1WXL8_9ACTN|nr:ATP-dependent DNA ligase [Friedmanniella luteola]SDT01461.1 ATP dependent DNA ligase domain-containing protein [Friedmanniella luteola]
MKFDGWRGVLLVNETAVELWSRHGTNLSDRFPDLIAIGGEQLEAGIYDGEIVVWRDGACDWDALLQRSGSPTRVADQARRLPASFVVFDLLALHGQDVRPLSWTDRPPLLELTATEWRPPLQLAPHTLDRTEALTWMDGSLAATGIEGVVVKGAGSPYRAGDRQWLKVRTYETSEVIVGAVTGTLDQPTSIIVGRYTATGELVIVGRTGPPTTDQAAVLAAALTPTEDHPWPARIGAGHFGGSPVDLLRVELTVVEVAGDAAQQAGRWRHQLRLIRLRPDLTTAQVDRHHPPAGSGR